MKHLPSKGQLLSSEALKVKSYLLSVNRGLLKILKESYFNLSQRSQSPRVFLSESLRGMILIKRLSRSRGKIFRLSILTTIFEGILEH